MAGSDINNRDRSAIFHQKVGIVPYFLITFIPIAIIIISFSYIMYAMEKEKRIALLIEQNRSMIELQREAITQDFSLITSDVLYLASEGELLEAFGENNAESEEQAAKEFKTFIEAKKIYDQLRFIDNNGMERIRVNYNGDHSFIVPKEKLQLKAKRYYFSEAINLEQGNLYISRFDLNIEKGKLELPHKPMIRFATPVISHDGRRLGVVVANYLGDRMLDHFIRIHAKDPELSHLVNNDGYWLHSNSPENEWGFMFEGKQDVRFQRDHPEAWPGIASKDRGHIENDRGIYCFSTIDPFAKATLKLQTEYKSGIGQWKVVAFNPADEVDAMVAETRSNTLFWSGLSLLVVALIAWLLARAIVSRREAEALARRAETRVHEAVQAALDSVITIDHESHIIEFNIAAEKAFGYSRDEILGQLITDTIIPVRLRERHLQGMQRHLNDDSAPVIGKRLETIALHKDGHEFPVELSITPVKTENTPVFTAFIRDLSEQKESAEKISILSQAIEQAGESIIITDAEGIIEYVNSAFCTITGYTPEEVIGNNPRILNSGEHKVHFYQEMWKTIKKGETWQGRIIDKRKDGSQYPSILTISPIFNDNSEITHFIGLQQNLQEYEELEERFHQAQKMEAIGTLVGGIAHDFNNSLAAITGNLYLIKKRITDQPEVTKKLKTVEALAFRASEMIQQLLSFSRRNVIRKDQINLPSFIKETAKLHEVSIPESISLGYSISEKPITVLADANQLQQMLINLINNARDALVGIKNASMRIELAPFNANEDFVERHPEATGTEFARISIIDNGSGISEENLNHIFEPFFTTKEEGQGTGLGLSMVYGTVHSHNGIIEVHSNAEDGTRFDIYLPQIHREGVNATVTGEFHSLEAGGHDQMILLVDDDSALLNTVREILEGLNYRTLTASNGEEAVKTFFDHHDEVKLVIMDVVMPKLGGVDALLEMRKIDPDIRCIFTTGYDKKKVLQTQGISEKESVLTKPYEVTLLSRLVQEKLNH